MAVLLQAPLEFELRLAYSANAKLLVVSGKSVARFCQKGSSSFVICRLHHQNVPVERRDNEYGASRRRQRCDKGCDDSRQSERDLDEIEAIENKVIRRDQVLSHVEGGNPNDRKYDGLWQKPDGTYEGYEIKSNSSRNSVQEANDAVVSYDNPARARLHGEEILITSVQKVGVFD